MEYLIGLPFVALFFLTVAWFLSGRVIYPRVSTTAQSLNFEVAEGQLVVADFEQLPQESLTIASPHGYHLNAIFLPQDGATRTVIISHGITHSLYGGTRYMDLYRRRGFNVLLYDLRHHGQSGGPTTTFGFTERDDLQAVCDWVVARCGLQTLIGTHGESLGAAISLQHAARDPRVAFVVADCPFSDLWELLKYRLAEDLYLPTFPLLYLANGINRFRAGFRFTDISPIRDIRGLRTPILFIHGRDDRYIPPSMSEAMYLQDIDHRRLHLMPGARHARSYWTDRETYDRVVGEFLSWVEQKTLDS